MNAHKKIQPLPYPLYFWTVAILALASLANAVYLAVSHYRVYTDMGYRSFCAVSRSINCDTVSQSPFSILLGVPVPVWGVFAYLFFTVLLLAARPSTTEKSRIWPTLFVVSGGFSIYSVILAFISTVYIHSYCIMCIASYAGNFALLYFTWMTYRRFGRTTMWVGLKSDLKFYTRTWQKRIVFVVITVIFSIMLVAFFPAYWKMSAPVLDQKLPTGTTADGHPWIGAVDPQLTIVEFTDYQCFQCRKMHFYLREFIAAHPGKIRLVHRHFPMDHVYNPLVKDPAYHGGSGKMALFALYAAREDAFWKINDMLFNMDTKTGHFNLRPMAAAGGFALHDFANAVNDRRLQYQLILDIREGMKLGVTGTPAYLIDGEVYVGNVPPGILEAAIQ